jgi:transcriptional regulator with XRE-family HTH domain
MAASENPDPIDVEVGLRIRIRRKWMNLSQSALAEHLGLTFQQVQKYERGTNRVSASMLVRIAQKLDTTVGALVGEAERVTLQTEMYQSLAVPGAMALIDAYSDMSSELRRAFLDLALRIREPKGTDPTSYLEEKAGGHRRDSL